MSQNNHGSQEGNNSINIGTGDFRNANLNINASSSPTFTSEEIGIRRHRKFQNPIVTIPESQNLKVFAIISGLASLVSLYFTVFTPQSMDPSWSTFFLFVFVICIFSILFVLLAKGLRQRKFEPFFHRKYYLEMGSKGGIYITSFTAICPWCNSKMNLRNVKMRENLSEDRFICKRNPRQHIIELDPTVLTDITE